MSGGTYAELRVWAEMFHDAQQARISAVNRSERGGVHPDLYANHVTKLMTTERECGLELVRCFRRTVPPNVRDWQKGSPGVGEHLLARLLGHLGHPIKAQPYHWDKGVLFEDEPFDRMVSQLWQYSGVGDPERKRKRGMSQEEAFACGVPLIKSLLFLIAQGVVKANKGYYREVYDKARDKYRDRVHAKPCVRCGPSGKPAEEGSAWNLGHQHAAALRKVSKEVLRDLWVQYKLADEGEVPMRPA